MPGRRRSRSDNSDLEASTFELSANSSDNSLRDALRSALSVNSSNNPGATSSTSELSDLDRCSAFAALDGATSIDPLRCDQADRSEPEPRDPVASPVGGATMAS
jgi:hypothetical protein